MSEMLSMQQSLPKSILPKVNIHFLNLATVLAEGHVLKKSMG